MYMTYDFVHIFMRFAIVSRIVYTNKNKFHLKFDCFLFCVTFSKNHTGNWVQNTNTIGVSYSHYYLVIV